MGRGGRGMGGKGAMGRRKKCTILAHYTEVIPNFLVLTSLSEQTLPRSKISEYDKHKR